MMTTRQQLVSEQNHAEMTNKTIVYHLTISIRIDKYYLQIDIMRYAICVAMGTVFLRG